MFFYSIRLNYQFFKIIQIQMHQGSLRISEKQYEDPNTYRTVVETHTINVKKIDQCYCNSYLTVVRAHWRYGIYHIIKIIFLLVCIGSLFQSPGLYLDFITPLSISILTSLFYIKAYRSALEWLNDLENIFLHAERLGHTGEELEQISVQQLNKKRQPNQKLIIQMFQSKSVYSYHQSVEGKPEPTKNQLQKVLVARIEHELKTRSFVTRIEIHFYDLVSIILIFSLLTKFHLIPVNIVFKNLLTFYFVVETFTKFVEMVILLIVAIVIPLGIVAIITYCIIVTIKCKKPTPALNLKTEKYSDKFKLDQPKCTICLQWFANDQDVIQLPCHQSHVYHKFCINNWIKWSKKCPLCKTEIAYTQQNLEINPPQS